MAELILRRHYIRLRTSDGYVDADLEIERANGDWTTTPVVFAPPAGYEMIEMTGNPLWSGIGQIPGSTRQLDGSFLRVDARSLKSLLLLRSFTLQEQIALETLAVNSPELRVYLRRLTMSDSIAFDDADTKAMFAAFVTAGVITQARSDEILKVSKAPKPVVVK